MWNEENEFAASYSFQNNITTDWPTNHFQLSKSIAGRVDINPFNSPDL